MTFIQVKIRNKRGQKCNFVSSIPGGHASLPKGSQVNMFDFSGRKEESFP